MTRGPSVPVPIIHISRRRKKHVAVSILTSTMTISERESEKACELWPTNMLLGDGKHAIYGWQIYGLWTRNMPDTDDNERAYSSIHQIYFLKSIAFIRKKSIFFVSNWKWGYIIQKTEKGLRISYNSNSMNFYVLHLFQTTLYVCKDNIFFDKQHVSHKSFL